MECNLFNLFLPSLCLCDGNTFKSIKNLTKVIACSVEFHWPAKSYPCFKKLPKVVGTLAICSEAGRGECYLTSQVFSQEHRLQ